MFSGRRVFNEVKEGHILTDYIVMVHEQDR